MLLASDLKQLVSLARRRSGAPNDSIKGASPAVPHNREGMQEQQQQHAGDKHRNSLEDVCIHVETN